MAQKTPRKAKSSAQAPPKPSAENPAWLTAPPDNALPSPPIKDVVNNLPLLAIRWENFERLCRRLAEQEGEVEKAWAYGGSGHTQLGIDVLVRMKDGSFEAWQSKRHKSFGVADVKDAVEYFLKQNWARRAKRFVLALACEIIDPKVIDQVEASKTQLKNRGIAFEAIGCSEITDKLRGEPEIVDDFFGRPWVGTVCRPGATKLLEDRISRFDVDAVRKRLRTFYTTWIATVDPGLPIAGQDKDGKPIPAPMLAQRYVLPDLILNIARVDHEPEPLSRQPPTKLDVPNLQAVEMEGQGFARSARAPASQQRRRNL